ncbi:MAG TPA: hypothetical protein VGM13_10360 [Thermoanaerobaculia bacterium]|jgi:hypothetical protein
MGTVSTPSNPRQPGSRTPSGATPAGGSPPLAGPSTTSRFRFGEDKPVSMGPSGAGILLTLIAAAVGAWLYFKAPSTVGEQSLQKYSGFEANMESVVMRNCQPPGCAAVYLTPSVGKRSQEALQGAIALSAQLAEQGIECFIVFGGESIPDAVKRARGIRRPVVFDPGGDWGHDSGIEKAPYWIAWRTGGKVRLRSSEPVSAGDVASAIR